MSEFSESFHVRAASRDAIARKMDATGMRGVVFEPVNGWCTIVPFDEGRTARELAKLFGAPVLRYEYAEDHGFAFELVDGGSAETRYEMTWDPVFRVDADRLDFAGLAAYLKPGADAAELEAALRASTRPSAQSPIAYAFAWALGLPEYEWLSPHTVTADFKHGELPKTVTVVGAPDADSELPCPKVEPLSLPRADLSAIEAVALLSPSVARWDPNAYADLISSSGDDAKRMTDGPWISSAGRITAHGAWSVRFVSKAKDAIAFVRVDASGATTVKPMALGKGPPSAPHPARLLDSTDIASITEPIYLSKKGGNPPLVDRLFRLTLADRFFRLPWGAAPWQWSVLYMSYDRNTPRWDLNVHVDAVSGKVIDSRERVA